MNPELKALLGEFEQVLERKDKVDRKKALELAARRFELEKKLMQLLRPYQGAQAEKRSNVRVDCDLRAALWVDGASVLVSTRNISCGGVLLEVPQAKLELGMPVRVSLEPAAGIFDEALVMDAEVAWLSGSKVGLSFLRRNEKSDRTIMKAVLRLLTVGAAISK